MNGRQTNRATPEDSRRGHFTVPLSAMVAVVAISLAFTSAGAEPRTPTDYYSAPEGDRFLYRSSVQSDGVVRWQRWIFHVVGETADCDGTPCGSFNWKENAIFDGRALPETTGRFFQVSNEAESCTWGYVDDDGKTVKLGCVYRDLVAPIAEGTSWEFSAPYPVFAPDYSANPQLHYTAEIVETGLTLTAAGSEYHDCIRTHQVGRAQPGDVISCTDGSTSAVRLEVIMDRWFCPVIGEVKNVSMENHIKSGPRSGMCISFEHLTFVSTHTPATQPPNSADN
jgi:hypothetical protein